jgi:hypothetical protein
VAGEDQPTIVLWIDAWGESIQGRLQAAGEAEREFHGWIDLAAAIEQARGAHGRAQTPAHGDGRRPDGPLAT